MEYTINEDGTVTRDRLPKSSGNNSGNNNNNGCFIWIAIVVGIIIINFNELTSNNDHKETDEVVYETVVDRGADKSTSNNDYELADEVVCDTMGYNFYADTAASADYSCDDSYRADNNERFFNVDQRGSFSNPPYINVTGIIKEVWVDHNVADSYGNKGMRIHMKFDINGMLNRTGKAAVYFYYANGNPIRDTNGSNRTLDGNVATQVDFTPNYENCTFNDLVIFMPYSELHLSQTTSCYFTITIWNGNTEVVRSGTNSFQFSLSGR